MEARALTADELVCVCASSALRPFVCLSVCLSVCMSAPVSNSNSLQCRRLGAQTVAWPDEVAWPRPASLLWTLLARTTTKKTALFWLSDSCAADASSWRQCVAPTFGIATFSHGAGRPADRQQLQSAASARNMDFPAQAGSALRLAQAPSCAISLGLPPPSASHASTSSSLGPTRLTVPLARSISNRGARSAASTKTSLSVVTCCSARC